MDPSEIQIWYIDPMKASSYKDFAIHTMQQELARNSTCDDLVEALQADFVRNFKGDWSCVLIKKAFRSGRFPCIKKVKSTIGVQIKNVLFWIWQARI